jgi:hypothetical protein
MLTPNQIAEVGTQALGHAQRLLSVLGGALDTLTANNAAAGAIQADTGPMTAARAAAQSVLENLLAHIQKSAALTPPAPTTATPPAAPAAQLAK